MLLDTHMLIWLVETPAIGRKQQRQFAKATQSETPYSVSAISSFEIGLLLEKKR